MVREGHEDGGDTALVKLQPHGALDVSIDGAPVVKDDYRWKGTGLTMRQEDVDGDHVVFRMVAWDRGREVQDKFITLRPLRKRPHGFKLNGSRRRRRLRDLRH